MSSHHFSLVIHVSEGPLVRVANIPVSLFISLFCKLGIPSVLVQTVLKRKTTQCRLNGRLWSSRYHLSVQEVVEKLEHIVFCTRPRYAEKYIKNDILSFLFDKMTVWRDFWISLGRWHQRADDVSDVSRWMTSVEGRWHGRWHQRMTWWMTSANDVSGRR